MVALKKLTNEGGNIKKNDYKFNLFLMLKSPGVKNLRKERGLIDAAPLGFHWYGAHTILKNLLTCCETFLKKQK